MKTGEGTRGSNAIFYLPRDKGGRGLRSVEMEYKATKIKSAVRLCCNEHPAIQMVREFEERAEEMGRRSMVKDAFKFSEELGIELNLRCQKTDTSLESEAWCRLCGKAPESVATN